MPDASPGGYSVFDVESKVVTEEEDDKEILLAVNPNLLSGLIADCKKEWLECLGTPTAPAFLAQQTDLRNTDSDEKQAVFYRLASAGYKLFLGIFDYFAPGDSRLDDAEREGLNERIEKFRSLIRTLCHQQPSEDIVFESCGQMPPWDLLYPFEPLPNEAIDLKHFLGLSHSVEHDPFKGSYRGNFTKRPLHFGRHRSDRISHDRFDSFLEVHEHNSGLVLITRDRWKSLSEAITSWQVSDQAMYFVGHGASEFAAKPISGGGEPELVLSGNDKVTSSILQYAFRRAMDGKPKSGSPLSRDPVVFINSCFGGDSQSMTYDSLSRVLLNYGAGAVIGPQVRIPTLFAEDFALTFFSKIFSGDEQPNLSFTSGVPSQVSAESKVTLGDALLATRRHFAVLENPLGLLYTRYGGKDIFLGEPILPRKIEASRDFGPDASENSKVG